MRAALSLVLGTVVSGLSCPCSDPQWCEPIGGPPLQDKEFYGFGDGDLMTMDWDYVTTVAWAGSAQVACEAHAHAARAILGAPKVYLGPDAATRTKWAQDALTMVQAKFMDGLVFDWEDPAPVGSDAVEWYVQLINVTNGVFKQANPSYQVSVCVAWSPDNIDGRGYDIAGFAASSDVLYVMDYDTRSQVLSQCLASANAPLPGTMRGVQRYLDLGVSPSQLILGVPWYGYRYVCEDGTDPKAIYCPIPLVPFRGVNCSDAAGSEIAYAKVMAILDGGNSTTGRRWDTSMQAPYFNTVEDGKTVQYWYDDPDSLGAKYAYAKRVGLRGVGPFTWADLDSTGDKTHNPLAPGEAKAMWQALDLFN